MALPVTLVSQVHGSTSEAGTGFSPSAAQDGFGKTLQKALSNVSQSQSMATVAEDAVASGKPGASASTALVLSDQAEIGWNAVVAVRNEMVSAYQTMVNMQI
ncbi:MAG TPA: flagellar hook-basal body complex protein FliE [Acetobacteraceae bacterium]|nr:flagellar hook-basal body complex protein FliE [Acetobacteraceae bacterium]